MNLEQVKAWRQENPPDSDNAKKAAEIIDALTDTLWTLGRRHNSLVSVMNKIEFMIHGGLGPIVDVEVIEAEIIETK
jgi:hypothetical protein